MTNTPNSIIIEPQFDFFFFYSENSGHDNLRHTLKKKITGLRVVIASDKKKILIILHYPENMISEKE